MIEQVENSEEKYVAKVSVSCVGIKRRCRKSEHHYFELGEYDWPLSEEKFEALKVEGEKKLDEMMRQYKQARLGVTKCKISNEYGFRSISFQMYKDNYRFPLDCEKI